MIRRAWHVLADPPASWEEGAARLAIPVSVALIAMATLAEHYDLAITRLLMLAWVLVALHLVRQRDQARAEVAQLRTTSTNHRTET